MQDILNKIALMTDVQLHKIMKAVRNRYRAVYPDWDVFYLALHKDPELRRQEFDRIKKLIEKDMQWHQSDSHAPDEGILDVPQTAEENRGDPWSPA